MSGKPMPTSTNPISKPQPPSFVEMLGVSQKNIINCLWNADNLSISDKIDSIGSISKDMPREARVEYRKWRFLTDRSRMPDFYDSQNNEIKMIIAETFEKYTNLEEFARAIMNIKPMLNNPDAFDKWMKNEEIEFKEPPIQEDMESLPLVSIDFDMNAQPEEVPIQKPKDKVLIQKLNDKILGIYDELKKSGKKRKEASFSASKTRKVQPKALIEKLEQFKDQCDSEKLKDQIQGIMSEVRCMCPGGDTRMFVRHDSEKDGSKLEFVCAVVYKYRSEGGEACGTCSACKACKKILVCGSCRTCKACKEPLKCNACEACRARKSGRTCEEPIACGECKACDKCEKFTSCGRCEECRKCETPVVSDYMLTTYSYKETINCEGIAIGVSTIVGGIILGAIALPVGIFTGGIGFTIVGAVAAGIAAGGGVTTGSIIISKSANTKIKIDLKNLLEACFVYEIVERNYAKIENGELYLELTD